MRGPPSAAQPAEVHAARQPQLSVCAPCHAGGSTEDSPDYQAVAASLNRLIGLAPDGVKQEPWRASAAELRNLVRQKFGGRSYDIRLARLQVRDSMWSVGSCWDGLEHSGLRARGGGPGSGGAKRDSASHNLSCRLNKPSQLNTVAAVL